MVFETSSVAWMSRITRYGDSGAALLSVYFDQSLSHGSFWLLMRAATSFASPRGLPLSRSLSSSYSISSARRESPSSAREIGTLRFSAEVSFVFWMNFLP